MIKARIKVIGTLRTNKNIFKSLKIVTPMVIFESKNSTNVEDVSILGKFQRLAAILTAHFWKVHEANGEQATIIFCMGPNFKTRTELALEEWSP